MEPTRTEHDSMGPVEVPAQALWQAQTQRALTNFPDTGRRFPLPVIHALARIKAALAEVRVRRGDLESALGVAIAAAARDVADGRHDGAFPLDVFQTGSGTSTNMNVNEVVATLASRACGHDVHPNDHVNAPLSSNDQVPSAIHLAALTEVTTQLVPSLELLATTLRDRARAFDDVVKAGRTHLMDAAPVTLGQVFAAHATQVEQAVDRLRSIEPVVGELAIGGSAVGTGLNVPDGLAAAVVDLLAAETGLALSEATDHVAANASRDALADLSGSVRRAALAAGKVAEDVRWMASGPATGLGEIRLPALQPGSSMMPGKVNPVLCEALAQAVADVIGRDATVTWACARGNFELNTFLPVIADNLLGAIGVLSATARRFAEACVAGIEADEDRCLTYAEATPQLATALVPLLGYDAVAEVVHEAEASGRSVRSVVAERALLDPETVARALDLHALAAGRSPAPGA